MKLVIRTVSVCVIKMRPNIAFYYPYRGVPLSSHYRMYIISAQHTWTDEQNVINNGLIFCHLVTEPREACKINIVEEFDASSMIFMKNKHRKCIKEAFQLGDCFLSLHWFRLQKAIIILFLGHNRPAG